MTGPDDDEGFDVRSGSGPEAVLAQRLLQAHGRVHALDLGPDERARAARRLVALSDAAKHDVGRASARLDVLLADLDAGRVTHGADQSDR